MSSLDEIVVFARVVETGSFTGAAAALEMPKSTVSRKISELEARLRARLLQRTTRKLNLTDVGRTYYAHCARIVAELEEAERAVGSLQAVPRGLLRVTTPLNLGFLGPIFAEFAHRFSEVELEIVATDRLVDLVEEGFDVAIRAGNLADSTLVARPLGSSNRIIVASARYLERHGVPREPAALVQHAALVFGTGRNPTSWRLVSKGQAVEVVVKPRLVVNDLSVLIDAARADLGVAMLPNFITAPEIRDGRLERVLEAWCSQPVGIYAVYPSTRHLSLKVKTFVEHLRQRFTPPPWEVDLELLRERSTSRRKRAPKR
ncbi:MAG: LysR family transcriptional regulator [Polyangiaceae bacterium]